MFWIQSHWECWCSWRACWPSCNRGRARKHRTTSFASPPWGGWYQQGIFVLLVFNSSLKLRLGQNFEERPWMRWPGKLFSLCLVHIFRMKFCWDLLKWKFWEMSKIKFQHFQPWLAVWAWWRRCCTRAGWAPHQTSQRRPDRGPGWC